MRHARTAPLLLNVVTTLVVLSGVIAAQSVPQAVSQSEQVIAHSSSIYDGGASLQFLLSSGAAITLNVTDGEVAVEHSAEGKSRRQVVTRYISGDELETRWRELVSAAPEDRLSKVRPSAI